MLKLEMGVEVAEGEEQARGRKREENTETEVEGAKRTKKLREISCHNS